MTMDLKDKIVGNVKNILLCKKFVIFSFVLGIGIRIFMAAVHFTHVDDTGAMNDIMSKKMMGLNEIEIAKNFWTYAPMQILFSAILVNNKLGYKMNIFLGRLPSLICGIAAMFMAVKFAKKFFETEKHRDALVVILTLICSLSWENIIYSAQAEPYEIVVLGGMILIYCMACKFYENWKSTVLAAIIFTVCCYSHYQFFILLFAMYVAVFICNMKNRKNIIRICAAGAGNFFLTIPLLILMKNTGMFDKTINWNIGIGGRFLFSLPEGDFGDQCLYLYHFFSKNLIVIYKYFMTVSDFSILSNALVIVLLVLSLAGIIYLHKKFLVFALYTDVLIMTVFYMILRGTLTFGPSRHMLFLFPTMLLLIGAGIACIYNTFCFLNIEIMYQWSLSVYIICFCLSIPNEIAERYNYISPKEINNLAAQYEPAFIYGSEWMFDLYGIEVDGYENLSGNHDIHTGWYQKICMQEPPGKIRFMIISKTTTLDSFLDSQVDVIVNPFIENAVLHGFDNVAKQFPDYKVIYKKELPAGREVEYASKHYWNWPNGLHIFILECAAVS